MNLETIDDVIDQSGVKICVYGFSGVGKTMLSGTTGGPTIILSAEAGLRSLKQYPPEIKNNMRVHQVTTIDGIKQAYAWFQSGQMCEWIVIDSLSEVAEVCLSHTKEGKKDPRAAYGDMADEMMKLIRLIRDLPNYNVMMIAKQTRITDELSGITSYVPLLPGKILTNQLPYMFDEVFCLRVEPHPSKPGKFLRVIQTGRDATHDCKDRSGTLDMFEPADFTEFGYFPIIGNIAAKISGNATVTNMETNTDGATTAGV